MRHTRSRLPSFTAGIVFALLSVPVWAVPFTPTNLVTDDPAANPGQITDPGLKNAWGLSFAPTGPFWVSSNHTGTSPLYRVNPADQTTIQQALTVAAGNGVTGQVFNSGTSFNGNRFLFVSETGSVTGWRPALGTTGLVPAETIVPPSAANSYKGVAIGSVSGNDYLYAANFKTGAIDVYKGNAAAPNLTGTFIDPGIPDGYAPFNVQNLNGSLYVAYAQQDTAKEDEVAGLGLGFVDKFNLNGVFEGRVASNGTLNAPWGLAVAPSSFGAMAGDLLVGNFGDGHINIYDSSNNSYLGQVLGANNLPVVIDGLWAISPGNGVLAGSSNLLYFTAGPNDEAHGVLGVLTPVPEPSAYAMMLAGLVTLGLLIRRRALWIETENPA
ncbi:PEP-CTERM sorting domain-containing protein [Nitrosospira lacus]|uniref:PEP-CTERM sorting domain-containing protein n=1 Tax=Nitrosospira lacus TaxID=1288494 RepID=A0A1W6SQN3_9PROT|nr:TIGR03118 family protein [Nitrosospira lacus]ARO88099.1 PEP-CTERM sorting domain-containing protein [Nitrosospira lacus]